MSNQLIGWDITSFAECKHTEVIEVLKQLAKSWVFQQEETKEAKPHWQIRCKLRAKKRKIELIRMLKNTVLAKAHIDPTCNKVHGGMDFNYVMKLDSRIAGPWKNEDKDEKDDEDFRDPAKMPTEVSKLIAMGLYPWQEEVKKNCEEQTETPDHIHINCICNLSGIAGKTWFAKFMHWHKLAGIVPAYNDMIKMIGFVATTRERPAYIFDLSRAMDKRKLNEFWAGIEQVKAGMISDWRHKGKFFNRSMPAIWVFTNNPPPVEMMSAGRFVCWMIDPISNSLIEWTEKRWARATIAYEDKERSLKTATPKRKSAAYDSDDEDFDDRNPILKRANVMQHHLLGGGTPQTPPSNGGGGP